MLLILPIVTKIPLMSVNVQPRLTVVGEQEVIIPILAVRLVLVQPVPLVQQTVLKAPPVIMLATLKFVRVVLALPAPLAMPVAMSILQMVVKLI